jgi:hypothetical protein
MNNGTIYYSDGTTATVTYVSATSLTSSVSKTVTAGSTYTIVYGGFNVTGNGTAYLQPTTDSTTAFQVQNAAGTSSLFDVDTTDGKIGIGLVPSSSGATLQVSGGANVTSSYSISGNTVLQAPGTGNTFVGVADGNSSLTGSYDTGLGTNSLNGVTSGTNDTAIGWHSLSIDTTGGSNTAIGVQALYSNNATANTALGLNALFSTTSGGGNTALGYQAGVSSVIANTNTTGANNTFLGYNSGPGSTTQLQSAASIGAFSVVSENNALTLGCVSGVNGCTTSTSVGIGTSAPGNLLSIGALTTAVSGAQIAVSTGGANNSGIVVQTVASQSSGYVFQAQNSSGTLLAGIDYQGNLTVKNGTFNGTLSINGHVITGNTSGTTTATVNANAGTSATCTVTGNDTGGQITVTTGSGSWASGDQCDITFASSYGSAPHPVISRANATSTSVVQPYVTSTTTNFSINFTSPDVSSNTYVFNYFNAQ